MEEGYELKLERRKKGVSREKVGRETGIGGLMNVGKERGYRK